MTLVKEIFSHMIIMDQGQVVPAVLMMEILDEEELLKACGLYSG